LGTISSEKGARRSSVDRVTEVVGNAVKSRRVLTTFSLLTVACALAVLTTGASAASKCRPLASANYTDPTGDGSGANAPDITGVTVTSYEGGGTTFQVALANQSEFGTDMLARIFVDSDKTASTGNDKGFEYMIQVQGTSSESGSGGDDPGGDGTVSHSYSSIKCEDRPVTTLFKWNGSGWAPADSDSNSWFGNGGVSVEINASDIGDALVFNFAVYAASNVTYDESGAPQLAGASFDWAPDTGTYGYQPFDYSSYSDPTGDGSGPGAPDITKVVVTKWKGAQLKFWIAIPGTEEFGEDMLMQVYLDSDSNAATGDPNGSDYMIQAQRASYNGDDDSLTPLLRAVSRLARSKCYQPWLSLRKWNGSSWAPVKTDWLDSWYNGGLRFSIDPADLGSTTTFNSSVYAAAKVAFDDMGSPSLKDAVYDSAPDTGSYGFPLVPENGQFDGVYKVAYKVTHSHNFGNMRRGSRRARTWKFLRSCKNNQCATKVVASGTEFKLSRTGKSFNAKAGGKFDCQTGRSARGTESYQLKVQKSRWIKGRWRVTNWVGTVRVVSPNNGVPECGGTASYTASLTGTLK
jgi:hypothetical protein